jgi:hypothetical protein
VRAIRREPAVRAAVAVCVAHVRRARDVGTRARRLIAAEPQLYRSAAAAACGLLLLHAVFGRLRGGKQGGRFELQRDDVVL